MAIEYVTLMVLLAESSMDFETLWTTIGGVNDAPDKCLSPVSDVISGGQFRSSVVDSWDTANFEEVSILGMNILGDTMWGTVFNAVGTTFETSSWLQDATFLFSTATPAEAQLVIIGDGNYALRMQPAADSTRSWFTITSHSLYTYGPLPVFYAAKDPSTPFLFPELRLGHLGCWPTSTFNLNYTLMYDKTSDNNNKPEFCVDACSGFHAAVLMSTHKCYCGSYDVAGTSVPSFCALGCPGDPSQKCGGYFATYGSVYHIQGDSAPGAMETGEFYSQSHTLSGTKTLQLSWTDILASPTGHCIYVTAVTIGVSASGTFSFTYSPSACSSATAEDTKTFRNGTTEDFATGTNEVSVGILCLRCLTLTFSVPQSSVDVKLYGPTAAMEHISVPVVVVQASRTVPDTTTTSTTSTSTTTSTTTTTTTTSPTTTTTTTPTTTTTTPTTTTTTTPTTTTPTTTSTSTTTPTTTPATTTTTSTTTSTSPTTTTTTTQATSSTTTATPPTTTTPYNAQATSTDSTTESATVTKSPCKCPCNNSSNVLNLTAEELNEKVLAIQKKLAVNVSELSATIRRLTSAEDNRPSAMSLGYLGISLIVGVFGTIFIIDASTLLRDIRKLVNNLKAGFCQQDVAPG